MFTYCICTSTFDTAAKQYRYYTAQKKVPILCYMPVFFFFTLNALWRNLYQVQFEFYVNHELKVIL